MTKPEGYDGFYADAATEREAEPDGRRVVKDGRWFWPRMKCGCGAIGCYDLTIEIGCKECLVTYQNPGNMQKVMEVYDLRVDKAEQLNMRRAMFLPNHE